MKVLPKRVKYHITEWRQMIARELSQDTVGGVSEGNDVQMYFDGDAVYRAMLAAISSAKYFVHLEMYMFLSDNIGQKFAHALSAKAREGIPVRVIYDSIGSSDANVMQWTHMRDAGIEVVEYRPVWFWRKRGGLLGRNHRKNLIVDGMTAFTGGMNIGNSWSRIESGENAWRDTHLRVKGSAAAQMNSLFVDTWNHSTDETLESVPYPENLNQSPQGSRCMVIGSQGLGERKQMRRLFSIHLEKAQSSVKMTMPYFVPPRHLRKSVQRASKRGVDITLLVPRDSDISIVDWLREGLYPKLLHWGVDVIEYMGPTLHAKTMIIDNDIAIIGSNNFDILSVLMNQETALVVFDAKIVAELEQQWQNDLKLSEPVTGNWRGLRPWWRLMAAKFGCFLIRRL